MVSGWCGIGGGSYPQVPTIKTILSKRLSKFFGFEAPTKAKAPIVVIGALPVRLIRILIISFLDQMY